VLSLRPLRDILVLAVAAGCLCAGRARAGAPVAAPEPSSSAPRPVDTEVERHATLGQRLLERGRGQEAIAEFRRAYELRADARFLFDIAEGYRQLGLGDQATFFYERYLSAAPDAPDREDVDEQIAALRRLRPPTPGAAPAAPTPAPPFAHDVLVVPLPLPLPVPVTAPVLAPRRPLWRRWWAWATLGALVVGGTVAAFALERDHTEVPSTALGDQKFY
jgi:tetratricopeptide (TPR) repeat protein